uniref:Uncharacterized protein n=1 Tax=Fagus sylvatica TaxID=28930 RepID=A0A2N9GPA9_FAGSY
MKESPGPAERERGVRLREKEGVGLAGEGLVEVECALEDQQREKEAESNLKTAAPSPITTSRRRRLSISSSEKDEQAQPPHDDLADSLNNLFTSVSTMIKSQLQRTNNQLEMLEKMNVKVGEEYKGLGDVASGLRVFVEQLKSKSGNFEKTLTGKTLIGETSTFFLSQSHASFSLCWSRGFLPCSGLGCEGEGEGAVEGRESGRQFERRGGGGYGGPLCGAYRGGLRGGFNNGEDDGKLPPQRVFEHHSGIGRGSEVKSNAKGLAVGTGELKVMTLINMFFLLAL